MQPVDYTTLIAACGELQSQWIPARIEQIYQCDRHTLAIALRTFDKRGWLTLSWHPQAARICLGDAPPRTPDTFTFSDQLRHQLNGFALIKLEAIAPWERVIDLQIAQRPGDAPRWHLYLEIMGKYSNAILTDADQLIIAVAHQVSAQQSSVRTVQTGQPYQRPPALLGTLPNQTETLARWQERVSLIPGSLQKQLLNSYQGLSPAIAQSLIQEAQLEPGQPTDSLTPKDWFKLFNFWQIWLEKLETADFKPGWTKRGYTVLGWGITQPESDVQTLLRRYYGDRLLQQNLQQLRHQLQQKISNHLKKLRQKATTFENRLQQSANADLPRHQADLLMANLHFWQPGMTSISLPDFATEVIAEQEDSAPEDSAPVAIASGHKNSEHKNLVIPLFPEKNAVQNAQYLYKQHQKLKRAKLAVLPLFDAVNSEIAYLEQVEASLEALGSDRDDWQALNEIRVGLIQQQYLSDPNYRPSKSASEESQPYRHLTPSGFEVCIGRNNRQNDHLTFRIAGDYDLWFHCQESSGSHVLLRLPPGKVPDGADLQFAADWAAYFSRARNSEQVPVVYTEPKYVYKPKGAKPGMVVYKRERLIWGEPNNILVYLEKQTNGKTF